MQDNLPDAPGVPSMYISWQKKFETGHPLIDLQHRLLVFLFKKLDAAIKTHQPPGVQARIVLELKKFVEFHFISEENVMHESGYAKLDAGLLKDLNAMIGKVSLQREFADDLLYFLNQWLIDHIAVHDQMLAAHVQDAADRPVAELFYLEYFQAAPPGTAHGNP
jgi:hemerythrin-like metal-binding protein